LLLQACSIIKQLRLLRATIERFGEKRKSRNIEPTFLVD
jgi:hypothetical protein